MIKSPVPPDTTPDAPDASGVSAASASGAKDTLATPGRTAPDLCDVRHTSAEVVEPIRRTLVSLRAAEALAATFSVLGDPTRVRLLDALAQQEMCVCELAELVDSSESAVSHQLRLLRSLRLVRSRRSGRLVFYRLDDEHIRRLLDQGRRHIEEETGVQEDAPGLAAASVTSGASPAAPVRVRDEVAS
jgi:ArsR family transcriptional regulator, lead/cadmium/zinc/bismuth-responsive transcriptional repressor